MSEELAIQTIGLARSFGAQDAVHGLDLNVPRGAVYGFLGLNGAGKSTTIRMLMGLLRRHGGQARVLGLDPMQDAVEIKRRVGYVADNPAFYEWMTVEEICSFVQAYRKKEWSPKRADELIERFRLRRDAKLRDLSKGQKAKAALVLALAFDPELLILDEPTNGLDPLARREFVEGVLAEYQEAGKTILISSHLVIELAGLVDHVGIIHEGRMAFEGGAESFVGSVRRVRMSFEADAPREIRCEGMISLKANGRDALLAVRVADEARTLAELGAFSPADLRFEPLNLEEALIEYLAGLEGRK